ncbi:MAG: malate dehydrogenase [Candidatus Xiphinematobacter sp.]|nr:MAG: malate dehydrogenase [Candidatus Xiphinematobacter sp.]
MKEPIHVAVTGAAGRVGYSLLPRIVSGSLFGPSQPIILQLIEVPSALKSLEGILMELLDCAFPLLESVIATDDLDEGFRDVNWALLVGSMPRKVGMERKDLLSTNGKIFVKQGHAIQRNAAADVRVLVIGNPCNTNCLIAMSSARDIPNNRWFAMSRLDENRAKAQLAEKAGQHWREVTNVAVWGNHSSTLYPDFLNARIGGCLVCEVIPDMEWLRGDFIQSVQQRGSTIIHATGLSSAQSAAHAIVETIRSIAEPTSPGDWHSVSLSSDGSYGIEKGLVASFPVRSRGGCVEIVQGLQIDPFGRSKIATSISELTEERAVVAELLKS